MEQKINLNLINILILLYKHRNMRVVSKILDRSESAISKDLSKLREQFSDPLFLRTQAGLEPSHTLTCMIDDLEESYNALNRVLYEQKEFISTEYNQPICIALVGGEYQRLAPLLFSELSVTFPNAKFELSLWDKKTLSEIEEGKITLGLNLFNEERSKKLYQRKICQDKVLVAIHKKFELTAWDEIKELPFILYDVPSWNEYNNPFYKKVAKDYLQEINFNPRISSIEVGINIATQHKMPIALTTRYLTDDFVVVPNPDNVEFYIDYAIYCQQSERNNPINKLLMDILAKTFLSA